MHLNKRASKYKKQNRIELLGEIDKFIVITGYFNIPLSIIDRINRHKISNNT